MRKRMYVWPSLLVVAGACFGPTSQVDKNAMITVTGKAQRADGSADANTKVLLIRHPDLFQVIGGLFLTVETLGFYCLAGVVDPCKPDYQATSGSDGGYSFMLKGADTQGSLGEALLFSSVLPGPAVSAPATGPAGVNVNFYIQENQPVVPPMKLWEALPSLASGPAFSWPDVSATVGMPADTYEVNIAGGGGTIWSQGAGPSLSAMVDPRATEDFSGNFSIWAHKKMKGAKTDFDFTWYSPSLAYPSQNKRPISRGKDCYIESDAGPVKVASCPLTDGNLGTALTPLPPKACAMDMGMGAGDMGCTPPPQNRWVYVDLGTAMPVQAVVLHRFVATGGSSTVLAIEGSADATTWTPLAQATAGSYQIIPAAGNARYVRLHVQSGELGAGTDEVAIF